jgi:hypothetical protein
MFCLSSCDVCFLLCFTDYRPLSRITAQLLSSRENDNGPANRLHFASFEWKDLFAIAPWMDEVISKRIDGAGLGH